MIENIRRTSQTKGGRGHVYSGGAEKLSGGLKSVEESASTTPGGEERRGKGRGKGYF